MNIVFGTVYYDGAFEYLGDFIDSINNQSCKDFRALIINDDINRTKLDSQLQDAHFAYEVVQYTERYSPAGLRIMLLIEAIKRNADILVIGDADDTFSSNRIEEIRLTATTDKNCTFFYNDIQTPSGETVFPPLPDKVEDIKDIADYNFLGMSNTAIRTNKLDLKEVYSLFEGDQPIFDWYLYSRLLIDGATGRYVDGAVTYYRYHGNNLVGNQDKDEFIAAKEIEVKKRHYKSLEKHSDLMKERYYEYEKGMIHRNDVRNPHFWWNYTYSNIAATPRGEQTP